MARIPTPQLKSSGVPVNRSQLALERKLIDDRQSQINEMGSRLRSEYEGVIPKDTYNTALTSLVGAQGKRSNKEVKNEIRTKMSQVGSKTDGVQVFSDNYERANRMRVDEIRGVQNDIFDKKFQKDLAKGQNPAQNHAMERVINKYSSVEQMIKKGGSEQAIKKKMGFKEDGELQEFLDKSKVRRQYDYQQGINKAVAKPTMIDAAMGYKVPHMAMGALGTAGLVSAMSGSRGQQTNAQLYGQQQPYY